MEIRQIIREEIEQEIAKNGFFKKRYFWTLDFQSEEMVSFDFTEYKTILTKSVKVSSRPNIKIEEIELEHGPNKYVVPGKSSWEDINFNFYVSPEEKLTDILLKTRRLIVSMYTGAGEKLEEWHLTHLTYLVSETDIPEIVNLKVGYKDVRYYMGEIKSDKV